jgi:hypothetical protein
VCCDLRVLMLGETCDVGCGLSLVPTSTRASLLPVDKTTTNHVWTSQSELFHSSLTNPSFLFSLYGLQQYIDPASRFDLGSV